MSKYTSVEDFVKEAASPVGLAANFKTLLRNTLKKPWVVPAAVGTGVAGAGIGAGAALYANSPQVARDETTDSLADAFGVEPEEEPMGEALGFDFNAESAKKVLKAAPWVLGAGAVLGAGQQFGKGLADTIGGGAKKLYQMAVSSAGSPLDELVAEDPILMEADPMVLEEAMGTMQRFAPSLATDKPSVRAFLREAATSGAGVNYNTVKLLSDAEKSIQQAGGGF